MKLDPQVLPADFRAEYDRLSADAKQNWQVQRLKAQTDHMFLACEVMGMDFQPNPHSGLFSQFLQKDPEQEKPLYDLDLQFKKRMILWPRGTFKTSSIIVEIVQLILNYPDIRILILSGSKDLAKRQIARVKRIFEKPSAKFEKLFPDFCAEKLGTSDQFTVPNRSTTCPFAEPTVAISTAKSVKAGSHFDVIFVDDLVNDQNYKNPKALQKCIEDYKDIGPLLQPAGFLYVTGTRYSFGDTYEFIMDKAREEMDQVGHTVWKFSIRTCWIKYCATCGHPDVQHDSDRHYQKPPCTVCSCICFVDSGRRDVLFPQFRTKDGRLEGHTIQFLESESREKGEEFFANQYENNPIAAGTQTFTPELIDRQTFFHLNQLPAGPIFVVGDLSYVGDDDADQSVLYVCKLYQGQIYVFDCLCGKWDSAQVAEKIFFAIMKYRPHVIWLERFLGWEAYDNVFRSYCFQRNLVKFPIQWVPMAQVKGAKKIRIGSIKGVLQEKRLWLFAGMPEFELLCKQLKRWPKLGKHDDFADCLGLVCSVPTGYQLEKVPVQGTAMDYIRKLNQPNEDSAYDCRIPGSY